MNTFRWYTFGETITEKHFLVESYQVAHLISPIASDGPLIIGGACQASSQ